MQPYDSCTNKPRGWYILQNRKHGSTATTTTTKSNGSNNIISSSSTTTTTTESSSTTLTNTGARNNDYTSNWKSIITNEDRIPARLIPLAESGTNPCPIHPIKVNYCEINKTKTNRNRNNNNNGIHPKNGKIN
jgi:hypothetical protein